MASNSSNSTLHYVNMAACQNASANASNATLRKSGGP